ncbi:ABC transporter substrate-binding protein [Myxococcota bacterium]|nr:ABC transporter substrate-binding protein [Myxococcota bacterium]
MPIPDHTPSRPIQRHSPARRVALGVLVAIAGLLAFGTEATAEAADSPALTRTEALITAFMRVEAPPEGAPLDDTLRARNRAAFTALDGFFDRERLVEGPITPHLGRLTPAELARYRTLFWETLRTSTYVTTGRFFAGAKHTSRVTRTGADTADVDVSLRVDAKDLDLRITFFWARRGTEWRLIDLAFDDASLVRDYQAQFGRILDKDGPAGLLNKLSARHEKEIREKGAVP